MRIGKYNLKINYNNETIIYNLITKINFKIPVKNNDKEIIDYIKINLKENIDYLKEVLVLVDDDYDDYNEFLKIKNFYNNQTEKGTFMIHLNYNCNLMCSYCYQSCIKDRNMFMHQDRLDETINFILKAVKLNNYNILDICFIGGEPLIYSSKILYIINKLKSKLDIKLVYSIITNGTIYNERILSKLVENNIINFQITLDGYKEEHDKLRIYKNNKGSYDKIINNLIKIQENFPEIRVSINCNINVINQDKIKNLLYELKNKKIKYPVSFSLVFDIEENEKYESRNDLVWLNVHKIALDYGYKFEPFYREMYLGCAMTQKNYHIIGVDGNLYKCINAVDNKEYLLTNIKEYNTEKYNKLGKKFFDYFPKQKMCRECELLPVCYGGCEYKIKSNGFICNKVNYYKNDIELIKEMYRRDDE